GLARHRPAWDRRAVLRRATAAAPCGGGIVPGCVRVRPGSPSGGDDRREHVVRRSVTSFTTGEPSDALSGLTVTGPADQDADADEIEGTVVRRGERVIAPGGGVSVGGGLFVIDHGGRIVNGVLVRGWVELRVEE